MPVGVRGDEDERGRFAVVAHPREARVRPGRDDVEVAVAVDVGREDRARPPEARGYAVLRKGHGPVVLVVVQLAVAADVAGDRVDVAVAVEVRAAEGLGRRRGVRDHPPGEGLGPVVLAPRDRVVVVGRGEDVDVAVAVEVQGVEVVAAEGVVVDDVLREAHARAERRRAADGGDEQDPPLHWSSALSQAEAAHALRGFRGRRCPSWCTHR